jgi:microcystin-dependent protein
MSDQFVGEIRMFGFSFAPSGWALCDGQLLAISSNNALFSLIGTFYGGNGTTNFGLPNLQSRSPVHQGQGVGLSAYTIGQPGGAETVTLGIANLPAHNHGVNVGAAQTTSLPASGILAQDGSYTSGTPTGTAAADFIANAGSGAGFGILRPYLTVNFCIALVGIFPSRN